jgi:hypothetical protein
MCMGHLTLSSTRQVVTLPQSQSCGTVSTPVVGVWVNLPELCVDGEGGSVSLSMLRNPYVWGSCVWYMRNEGLLERVWEEDGVFLLVSQ